MAIETARDLALRELVVAIQRPDQPALLELGEPALLVQLRESYLGLDTVGARAVARESHWLRAAPEATAALVWNRPRQLGWSAEEIGEQIRVPAGSRFLRVRHLATRESAALVRDLVGHASRVLECAVTPDGRRVVSASYDETLKMWDLASGRAEATLAIPTLGTNKLVALVGPCSRRRSDRR